MDKINSIIFIQLRFKFLFKFKKIVFGLYNDIYKYIQNLSIHIENIFQLKLISNYIYNNINNELNSIIVVYNTIKLTNTNNKKILVLNSIKIKLKNILNKVGCNKLQDIDFYYNIKFNSDNLNELKFINKYFIPTNIILYNKNNINHEYDMKLILSNDKLIYSKQTKKNITIFEHINGCIIYLKINNNIFIITGYFIKDNLNLIRQNSILNNKYNSVLDKSKYLKIPKKFKYNYLKQMSLCDFFIYSCDNIIGHIHTNYFKIINYEKNNISYIVKDFLNKNINEQLELIVLLLITNKNELEYIAYLLFDLINNESYLLKTQPLSEQIYNNLHWSLQRNFKNSMSKINDNIKINTFKIEDISYEKRILLLNCEDYIKQNAIDKYKEIINKSNENSSKSQQYLDSLLKIPFNIYKKEEIIYLKDTFESKILYIIQLVNSYINKKLIDFPLFNNNDKLLYIDMINIINNLKKFNNLNNNVLELYVKQNKNKDIKIIIDSINNDQNINKYKNKSTKKEYLESLIDFFSNNNISTNIKEKYNTIININSNDLNNTINTLILEWNSFKLERKKYINNIDTILNNAIYSQHDAKIEIKRIIGQWINGKMTGYSLGFEGPPGIGKTSLAKKGIANCLIDNNGNSRPFYFLALGGSSNGSFLEGHNYTYVGSNYGKIIEILIQTKCMNPIIYIDELDKISNTENGKEIVGILTHLTDSTQNDQFNDKYFSGIQFDLSKVLFVFSYNDFNKLDPILADRIHRIKFNYLQKYEKINIMNNYIIPELLNNIGYNQQSIEIPENVLIYIIDNYTCEAGVRKLKEKTNEIIRQINLDSIMNDTTAPYIKITLDYVKKLFANKPKMYHKKIYNTNYIGIVNGLYATTAGIGGIIPIQVTETYNNTKMNITITGQQGDVMKESIYCAKTIVWNLLPITIKKEIEKKKLFGLHLHCPEAATPKDGPSAGGAITLAIISLLTKIKVKQTIGLTGEIDLKGNITKIGGLDLKIQGGKDAGLKTILIPYENETDYDTIKLEKPTILENIEIKIIKTIKDILEICLEDNTIKFIY